MRDAADDSGERFRRALMLAATGSAAFLVWLVTAPPSRVDVWVSDVVQQFAPMAASVACIAAARRSSGTERIVWAVLAASGTSFAAGQAMWSFHELLGAEPTPFPSAADVGWLTARALYLAAAVVLWRALPQGLPRAQLLLDAAIIATGLLLVGWATILDATLASAGADAGNERSLAFALPFTDLLTCSILIALLPRVTSATRLPLALLAAGPAVLALANTLYAYLILNGRYATGDPLDLSWVAGHACVALAALHPSATRIARHEWHVGTRLVHVVLPYVPVLVGVAFAIGVQLARGLNELLLWTTMALLLLVLMRQLLVIVENFALNRGLERAVAERTSELRASEEQLRHRAYHDALTGLPNRVLLRDRLAHAIDRAARDDRPAALLLIDLDDFKLVNDTMGHLAGDALLRQVAERLIGSLRTGDTPARLGGDEFACLLEATTKQEAVEVAERVLDAISSEYALAPGTTRVGATVGVAIGSSPDDADAILQRADIALYAGKERGKHCVVAFDTAMSARLTLVTQLRKELAEHLHDEIIVHYQPIFDLRQGGIAGAEALVRWRSRRGLLLPAEFIPAIENADVVIGLGRRVIELALNDATSWTDSSGAQPWVAVNAAARQLESRQLREDLDHLLARHAVSPDRLVVEVSEDALFAAPHTFRQTLSDLRALGVRIALDDFGTGASSLAHLHTLPVDIVKIDKSFITAALTERTARAVAGGIAHLGNQLDLDVVAEGIETAEHHDFAVSIGCTHGQGFALSAPVPAPAIADRLSSFPEQRVLLEDDEARG